MSADFGQQVICQVLCNVFELRGLGGVVAVLVWFGDLDPQCFRNASSGRGYALAVV